jgi:ABC-type lipoprotein release transport system permease subunit
MEHIVSESVGQPRLMSAVFVATALSVLAVALVASYLPARSAGRVDPMLVLRDA